MVCDICNSQSLTRLYECQNCKCKVCWSCISKWSICPNCRVDADIKEVEDSE
jgi:hypothetical protein